jgi:large repetitive protein
VSFSTQVSSSTGALPSGTVTFKDGATTLGSGTLNSSGVASFSTNALAGGLHSITAVYGGNANLQASTSVPLAESITIPGGIAFESVAHASVAQTGTNLVQMATTAITINPGDTVIVAVAASGYSFPTVSSVVDSGGNGGYVHLATQVYYDMAQVFLWGATNVSNAASSVTVTLSNPMASVVVDVATYSGVTAFGNVATAKGLTYRPNLTVATQDANNVVVMGVAQLTNGITTYTPNVGGLRDWGNVISPLDIGFALNDNSSPTAGPVLNEITSSGGGNWAAAAVELRSLP